MSPCPPCTSWRAVFLAVCDVVCVGYVPGSCYSTRLAADNEYILIAEVTETIGATGRLQVRPVDTEIVAISRNINEVASACRLIPLYPHGTSPPELHVHRFGRLIRPYSIIFPDYHISSTLRPIAFRWATPPDMFSRASLQAFLHRLQSNQSCW